MTDFLVGSDPMSGPDWVHIVVDVFLLLLFLGWLFVAATTALRGDTVDKPNRIPQFYGFTVCLLAIVVGLISISSIIGTMFDRANPLVSNNSFGESLTSFSAYKSTSVLRIPVYQDARADPNKVSVTPFSSTKDSTRVNADSILRAQYDARVSDRIAHVRYETGKSLTTDVLLLLIAIVLFATHWRWVRRLNGATAA